MVTVAASQQHHIARRCLIYVMRVYLKQSQHQTVSFRLRLENASGFINYMRGPSLLLETPTSQLSTNRSAPHESAFIQGNENPALVYPS